MEEDYEGVEGAMTTQCAPAVAGMSVMVMRYILVDIGSSQRVEKSRLGYSR